MQASHHILPEVLFTSHRTAFMNHNDRIDEVRGERIIPEFFVMSLVAFAPKWFRPFVGFVCKYVLN